MYLVDNHKGHKEKRKSAKKTKKSKKHSKNVVNYNHSSDSDADGELIYDQFLISTD